MYAYLIEDVGGVVSLLPFLEGLGTILETAMWELQSTFFSLGPEISFLRPSFSLKKWESIKVLIRPDLLHCIHFLPVRIWFPWNVP